MRCVKTVKFETYCPTGNSIEARKDQHGLVDITNSLLTTYTGPPGLKNREIKGLYDKTFKGKLWKENTSSKIAKLRLYAR